MAIFQQLSLPGCRNFDSVASNGSHFDSFQRASCAKSSILNRIRLEVGAFGMADASANDTTSQATHKDAMVQRYLRRQSLWYRLLRPPLPLIANPHESSLPPVKEGPKLFVGGA